jgi:hypothetical protein
MKNHVWKSASEKERDIALRVVYFARIRKSGWPAASEGEQIASQ